MSLRPYKFVVQAIVQEIDDKTGDVVAEHPVGVGQDGREPFVVYGCDQLGQLAKGFPAMIVKADATPQSAAKPAPNRAQRRAKPKPKPKR